MYGYIYTYNHYCAYLLAGICMFQETLQLGALLEVIIFQSHPDISPRVPVTRKSSVVTMHATS